MDKQPIGAEVATPLSMGLKCGNLVFISGQVPVDFATGSVAPEGIEAQTRVVLEYIEALLREVGADRNNIVKTTVFLTDIAADFNGMNDAYRQFFGEPYPARSTIGVELAIDVKVEIEALAII